MGFLTYLWRDVEQIVFPNRDPHAIPSMDGAFSPNDRLDRATPIGDPLPGADAVAEAPDGAICISAGNKVWRLSGAGYQNRAVFAEFDTDVGALSFHPDGRLLACTGRGLAALVSSGVASYLAEAEGEPLHCLTAVAVAPDGTIFVSDGSVRHPAGAWCFDLMERNSLGRIIACGPALQSAHVLLRGLAYPAGLAVAADGQLWFTESFAHRLSRAPVSGSALAAAPQMMIRNLPGYPSRLGRSADGGFWLSLFAVRTHLVEFVLREDDFREEMMRTIPPAYWVAPALASGADCLEPLQLGGLRALGIEKPWAPPRSYGLVARLNADGEVVESLHSRVGGRAHGITAVLETDQGVVIVSKGSGRVLLQQRDAST
ncbi:MAG TPA: SMP-30/gluconolactonase/LRE family protein [Xanthobacteraceae bacterium]|nr:SMP-30/gluconolactonase/LRE family protein [Xanthobacteraceae bacterium]